MQLELSNIRNIYKFAKEKKKYMEVKEAINRRYTYLSDKNCCLSCGSAINYSAAQAGEICVDLGSGRGSDVIRLAGQVGDNGYVYGIDISEGMIQKAESNLARFMVTNARIIQSELEMLPLETQTVNLVISNCSINHAKDKQTVWNEVYRILKPGGRFVVSDIYAGSAIADEYRHDPVAVSECWAGAITRTEYLEMLENAGFANIRVLEESDLYKKGKAEIVSITIYGEKNPESFSKQLISKQLTNRVS